MQKIITLASGPYIIQQSRDQLYKTDATTIVCENAAIDEAFITASV